ncbi:Exodeoxyribonuclease 7 large subunit [Rubripirellula amarantea]|uniref:Exodeoxyribonuclease 7 large subunit n=1 Tax=Rubripirellula amarantea TaxID=2527999 RepID=A0A5C5WVY0_9BACT|nr:exodeoxyribonuclease VII large subunit [Rubripirellula amarantea]TWT54095.1 Exodeoxyribonuclease 7 large subunit [Rubripirellula amarantea]
MMHPGYDNPETESPHSVSVSELTGHIKAILEGTFPSVWIAGEISDLVKARSGHLYFTLKDNDAQIRGIIWRSTAMRLRDEIKEGQAVLCLGDVEVYAARGSYQLVVRQVQQQGLGPLQQKFEKLRAALHAEGLFSAELKKPLPAFPKRIGVITSPSSAAVRDFLKASQGRFRGTEIIVIPALVQGVGSVPSITQAIKAAHANSLGLDVIVLTRGGGSLEDLWSFNEEAVVRAVAKSKLPIVSAIGHEIDITLCDLAADVRALTPTDAASQVLPDAERLTQTVLELELRLRRISQFMITTRREELKRLESSTVLRKPFEIIQLRSRLLDEWDQRARRAMESKLKLAQARLVTAAASLSALSPLDVLTRGYSVTLDSEGNAIKEATKLKPGDAIQTRLHQGRVESTVVKVSQS